MSGVGHLPNYASEEMCVCVFWCVYVCVLPRQLIHGCASPRAQSQGVLGRACMHGWPCCVALVLSSVGCTPGPHCAIHAS